jgi:hypothetical protein
MRISMKRTSTAFSFVCLLVLLLSGSAKAALYDTANAACDLHNVADARREALAQLHAAGSDKTRTADAALARLQPLVKADCLHAGEDASGAEGAPPAADSLRAATEYAWMLSDASVYFMQANGAGHSLAERFGDRYCFALLAPLLTRDDQPLSWLPASLRKAVLANLQQCAVQCIQPECVPDRNAVWSSQTSQATRFERHPACAFDRHAVQLRDDVCVDFNAGAYAHEHSDADVGNVHCVELADQPQDASLACPSLRVLTRTAGQVSVHVFPPAASSALADVSSACVISSLGVDSSGTRFALLGSGRDCFGGTADFSVEEIYELKDGRPVMVKNNSAGFH